MNFKNPQKIFWDVDLNDLDKDKHIKYIVDRVITRGTLEDWKEIKSYYGLEKIKEEILMIRYLDPKTLNFFSQYLNLNKKKFRCYSSKQSNQTPFHF